MPRIEFPKIEDAQDFSPIPAGQYLCRVERVEETKTLGGDDMWRLGLVVTEGPHEGRWVFDNLAFSPAALKRVKLVCAALGVDVTGTVDLLPSTIRGCKCRLDVDIEQYVDNQGRDRERNTVPFAGYEPVDAQDAGASPF